MYYEINVALNGRHFFATSERSLTDREKALAAFKLFRVKFPESEGYDVTATFYQTTGTIHTAEFVKEAKSK